MEGAGLLKFSQIKHFYGSYTVQDPYKKLFKIRSPVTNFCTCCLLYPGKTATIPVVNMDGSPSGSYSYKKWLNLEFSERTFCVHFIPNLDRKAKYMMFAAGLLPVSSISICI